MNILDRIDAHRKGDIDSIPLGHSRLAQHIFIHQNMYHLIGGMGGTGKSSFVDQMYAIKPHYTVKNTPELHNITFHCTIRSLERSKELRKAKWITLLLYMKYGILIDSVTMLGFGKLKSVVTDELLIKIKEMYAEIESWEDNIEIIDGTDNPTGLFKYARDYAEKVGTYYTYKDNKPIKRRNGIIKAISIDEIPVDNKGNKLCKPFEPYYQPDDPYQINTYIIDNFHAMNKESGLSDKQNLDKMSQYARILRDVYKYHVVGVAQLNRGTEDTMRKVKTSGLPQKSDFAGSDQPYSDCDAAAIMFDPYKVEMNWVMNMDVKACVSTQGINRLRTLHLLKNTYGADNKIFAYQFIGEVGMFNQIDKLGSKMDTKDYKQIANPKFNENYV